MNNLLFIHIPKNLGSTIEFLIYKNSKYIDPSKVPRIIRNFFIFNKSLLNEKLHLFRLVNSIYKDSFSLNNKSDNTFNRHSNIIFYKKNLENFDSYTSFCIVRNPYSRIISLFKFSFLKKNQNKKNFIKFINDLEKGIIQKKTTYFNSQKSYIIDTNEKIIVNKIFKMEDTKEIVKFLNINGLDVKKLPKLNNSDSDFKINLDKKLKSKIFNIYKEDFISFGYKK